MPSSDKEGKVQLTLFSVSASVLMPGGINFYAYTNFKVRSISMKRFMLSTHFLWA